MPCGETAAEIPAVAKRAPEPPVFQTALPGDSQPAAHGGRSLGHTRAGDPGARASSHRLSVVLRL
jgi:hypothetical protein